MLRLNCAASDKNWTKITLDTFSHHFLKIYVFFYQDRGAALTGKRTFSTLRAILLTEKLVVFVARFFA